MAVSIIIIVIGLLGSAFISASEAALISVNKVRMRRLAEEGDVRAQATIRVTREHEKFFGSILLTGNVFNIMVTAVATSVTIQIFDNNNGFVVALATAIAAVMIVIAGELTPKSVATLVSERWSLIAARPVWYLMVATAPIVWFFAAFPRLVVRMMGGKQALITPTITEGELRMLIDVGEEEGTVESARGEMLESVFRFGEMQVADVMSPRNEIIWVESGTMVRDFLDLYQRTQHTRFPVFEDDEDDVVGILSIKDVLQSLAENPDDLNRPVTNLMRKPYFVPESARLRDLFDSLQSEGHKIALVVDEFGGIAGVVTLTRILELIVGRTGEEGLQPSQQIVSIGENTFELDGAMSIDEANDRLDLHIPDGDYNTVAGFVLENVQRIPESGFRFRFNDLRFRVTAVDGNKISRVEVRVPVTLTPETRPEG
ncbi:MAG: HlyC/CorC family transporter [Chloroflexi bacterium]|nr:HlyC/CorC family transporter [Chloroflexota bacterium]